MMEQQPNAPSTRQFFTLSLVTALLTLGLIVFGAVVRVTDSGLGCGDHWPLCNGTIFPPLDNLTAWIEWTHRLFALLIGVLGVWMLIIAVRNYRTHNRLVLGITIAAAVLYFLQSALGAIVVKLELPPTMVTLHLGTAMLLLGALLAAAILVRYQPETHYPRDHVTFLAYITTTLSLVIILTGALVRGSGATLACTDWPLCNGEVFPFDEGQLALIHFLHRFAVITLGLSLVMLVWFVLRDRQNQRVRLLAVLALVAYGTQAIVGALYVLSSAESIWGAAHVGTAATTWALLVSLSVIENLHTREWAGAGEALKSA
jgi:heme A synthase